MLQKINLRKQIIADTINCHQTLDFFTTWTSSSHWPSSSNVTTKRLLILDSSFNPPTKAHANLMTKAFTSKPPNYFDASLLLFSTTNADKQFSGANVLQRAQMMELMAQHFTPSYNMAVGLTIHAKFVDKAKAIQAWFKSTTIELYFILGYDTIIRLFDPKYYAPLSVKDALAPFFESQHGHIICADRGDQEEDITAITTFWDMIQKEYPAPVKIYRIKLDSTAETISSTLARCLIAAANDDNTQQQLEQVLDRDLIEFIKNENLYIYNN